MSVIQTIRDKYATLMVVVVCVSLVAFLLMDALVGPKSFLQKGTDVGVVNGEGLDYRDFTNQVQNAENQYRTQNQGQNVTDEVRHQIRESIWNKFVQDQLLGSEYQKLGIAFSGEELSDLTMTMDADPQIKQIPAFQNPQTGQFEPNRVAAFVQQLKSAPRDNPQVAQQLAQWMQLQDLIQNRSLITKFSSLITQAIYIPKWLAKEKQAEKSSFATMSYVSVPYTSIPDSSIKLTESSLQSYLDSHSALFQQEASRSVQYVTFDAIPTAKDTAALVKQMTEIATEMDTLSDAEIPTFISRNSETSFYDGYLPASMIQSSEKDSLLNFPDGKVLGPYYDNGSLTYARVLGKKPIPDTVEMQHLLISLQTTPDTTAKRRADSLLAAVKNGADFESLVAQFSDGPKEEGGKLELTPGNPNIPEAINNFAFDHKKGDVGVVKSEYGYSILRITDQKDFQTGYKIAYLSRHLDPSQETDNAAFSAASQFAGNNRTRAAFEKSTQGDKGVIRHVAENIAPDAYEVQGIGSARDLIQWAFKAKVGDVSDVFSLGNHNVVALLTASKEKGIAQLADVRPQIEALVRRDEKAKQIAAKMKGSSLGELASALKDTVSEAQHIGFSTPFIPNAGFEPKVVGAAFNTDLKGGKLSSPVYGNNGVYVLKVDSVSQEPTPAAESEQDLRQEQMMLRQQVGSQVIDVLKKEADIEDHRLKFF